MYRILYGLIFSLLIFLSGCDNSKPVEKKAQKTITVKQQQLNKTLYFSGTIEPIRKYAVTVPYAATVETLHVNFGQTVKKGEGLIELNSVELQKNINDTLTAYLKAKNQYSIAQSKFIGTQELWDAGLISKNAYLSEKSTLENNRVSLLEAQFKLKTTFTKVPHVKIDELVQLKLNQADKIKSVLNRRYHILNIKSPADGIVLYPPKSNDDKESHLAVGAQLKAGQVIALIGDLSGISLQIKISEVEIDKFKNKLTARVKSVAFPEQVMTGFVSNVNSQAVSDGASSSGYPVFSATIEVPKLTPKQHQQIKVGMSASIEVDIATKDVIMVPIKAVFRQADANYVKVKAVDGNIESRKVVTGVTSVDNVVINSGLSIGDVVIYD